MPFYAFKCHTCGAEGSHYAKIADRDVPRRCESFCDLPMDRVIQAPALRPDISAYQSPIDGRWIDSRTQRKEDLKRSGSIEYDPEMKKDLPRIRASQQAKLEASLDTTVEKTVAAMHASNLL